MPGSRDGRGGQQSSDVAPAGRCRLPARRVRSGLPVVHSTLEGPWRASFHAEAAAGDDGIVAEPVPHRVQRIVDLPIARAGVEEVALENAAGFREIVGADADQAESAPVGLTGEQRRGRLEHFLGRLRGGREAAGAG